MWIIYNQADRVYQFDNVRSLISGSKAPSASFALAAGNTNPQGIADPPAGASMTSPVAVEVAAPSWRGSKDKGRLDLFGVALDELGRARKSLASRAPQVAVPQILMSGEALAELATELVQGRKRPRSVSLN